MNILTGQCPQCPAWAIGRPTGVMLPTDPPQTVMEWWCDCGYRAPAPPNLGDTMDDQARETWRAANWSRLHAAEVREMKRAVQRARRPWWRFWRD